MNDTSKTPYVPKEPKSVHLTCNPASGRVMEKAGMTYKGHLRQHVYKTDALGKNGVYEDLRLYAILRDEFKG